jgi:hypothetical protein
VAGLEPTPPEPKSGVLPFDYTPIFAGVTGLEPILSEPESEVVPIRPHPNVAIVCRVGVTGFEPVTTRTQNERATKLRYTPMAKVAVEGGTVGSRDP